MQLSGQGACTCPNAVRDFSYIRSAVRKQLRQYFLYFGSCARALCCPRRKCFFCVSTEQLVEMGIASHVRERRDRCRESDLIDFRSELDLGPEKGHEIRWRIRTKMPDSKSVRRQPAARHLPAYTHQRHQPKFYVMSIQPTVNVDILKRNGSAFAQTTPQTNSFVNNAAVALRIRKGVGKVLRRGYYIVD